MDGHAAWRRRRCGAKARRKSIRQALPKLSNMRVVCFPGWRLSSKRPDELVFFAFGWKRKRGFRRVMLARRMSRDVDFMHLALEEARAAAAAGEVPVGAILVRDGEVVARAGNRTIRDCDPTAHAEMVVLREGARAMGNYRLTGVTLYVTVEPCSMCAGAMIQARVPRLVYGCDDPKGGAVRSCFQIVSDTRLNHRVEVIPGVLAAECGAILQSFFAERR